MRVKHLYESHFARSLETLGLPFLAKYYKLTRHCPSRRYARYRKRQNFLFFIIFFFFFLFCKRKYINSFTLRDKTRNEILTITRLHFVAAAKLPACKFQYIK
ncbi:hypothetical protein PUN28_001515 [Cardiocondyla obscurior]|uniref:Ribosomal protein S10 n=1 Tax=Cardiocondyla obscurior TaxID=286306 RepID=A0AAW2H5Z5_9HYME